MKPHPTCRKCKHDRLRHRQRDTAMWPCSHKGCYCIDFDGRTEIEVEAESAARHAATLTGDHQLRWEVASILMVAFGKAEPDSSISQNPCSYVATFLDMARALIDAKKVKADDGE